MPKLVRSTFARVRPLTAADRRRLAKVRAMPDSKIDFSEIPPLSAAAFKRGKRNPLLRKKKVLVDLSLKLDSDVVAWASSLPLAEFDRAMNDAFRQAMVKHFRER
jgi:uncharacterized protein (DUF4415 family)